MKSIIKYSLILFTLSASAQNDSSLTFERPKNHYEAYLSIANNPTLTAGLFRVNNVAPRLSLAYGLSYSQNFVTGENIRGLNHQNSFNIPVEVRYYVTNPEKRFSAFIYSRLINSFDYELNYQPQVELGAALEYKMSNQSSIFVKAGHRPDFFK